MLPDILEVAKKHNLTFHPKTYGKKQTLAKCPFCMEDDKPKKKHRYYLSMNTIDHVFQCFFCKEAGGVLKFIALLEGVRQNEITARFRKKKGNRYKLHPAEKLLTYQYQLMGIQEKPNWVELRRFDIQSYKRFRTLIWKAWKQYVNREIRISFKLIVVGIESGNYEREIARIKKREKEIGADLLEHALKLYSLSYRNGWLEEDETFALHVANPKKYPYSITEEKDRDTLKNNAG